MTEIIKQTKEPEKTESRLDALRFLVTTIQRALADAPRNKSGMVERLLLTTGENSNFIIELADTYPDSVGYSDQVAGLFLQVDKLNPDGTKIPRARVQLPRNPQSVTPESIEHLDGYSIGDIKAWATLVRNASPLPSNILADGS